MMTWPSLARPTISAYAARPWADASAAAANPRGAPGRHARHHRMRDDVARDDCARSHERVLADAHTAHDGRVRADGDAPAHQRRLHLRLSVHGCARVAHVGKHGGRPDKDAVLQHDAVVDGDVVLNPAPVSDHGGRGDEYVLTQHAARADARARHHVAEMPDLAARTDPRAGVDDRGGMGPEPLHAASNAVASSRAAEP